MNKRFILISIILFLSLCFTKPVLAEEPQVVGETAVVIDGRTGTVLYGKDEHKKMYPASTTKVLTALVALERAKLSDIVTIGPNPSKIGGTSIWLAEGEKLSLEELLYALLLNSANDAAIAIAEHVSGSVENFADLSNKRAAELGAKDTHFTNPNGMPDNDHYTTAYDLALIARKAMENKDFRKIVSTVNHEIPRTDPEAQKYLFNHNKLLWSKLYGYKGATGVKTGYTVEAGQCIIASAEKDGRELIAVVLHSDGNNIWSDPAHLLDYGFANFTDRKLVEGGKIMADIPVKFGKSSVKAVAANDYYYTFPTKGNVDLQISTEPVDSVAAPVKKGQVLGAVVIHKGKEEVGKVNLVAAGEVARDWSALLKSFSKWIIPPVIVLLWIRRRIRITRIKKKRLEKRKKYYGNFKE